VTRRALVLALLATGCRVTGTFECERSEQCRSNRMSGTCEPTGFCSFPDPACPSGLRYSEYAGGGYAEQCTITLDAAAWTPASCPGAYNITLPSTAATSRYRIVATPSMFWPHENVCSAGMPGATHAINLETTEELADLRTQLDALSQRLHYVGAVQDPAATAADAGWINMDGTPVATGLWTVSTAEPDDGDGGEDDHLNQLATYDRQVTGLRDAIGTELAGIVCECDGLPVSAMARTSIDTDPNNPN
jgi:hypothetical protein